MLAGNTLEEHSSLHAHIEPDVISQSSTHALALFDARNSAMHSQPRVRAAPINLVEIYQLETSGWNIPAKMESETRNNNGGVADSESLERKPPNTLGRRGRPRTPPAHVKFAHTSHSRGDLERGAYVANNTSGADWQGIP